MKLQMRRRGMGNMPAGYTELEYLDATDAYAQTGLYVDDLTYELRGKLTILSYMTEGVATYALYCRHKGNNTQILSGYNWRGPGLFVRYYQTDNLKANSVMAYLYGVTTEFTIRDGYLSIWDVVYTKDAANRVNYNNNASYFSPLVIGNYGDSPANTFRWYSFQLLHDGELVLDFVPVANAHGVAGFYDRVGKVFYPSVTDTPFVAGPVLRGGNS